MDQTTEKRQSLWLLAASPTVWAAHFLLSYITVSVWCAKWAEPSEPLTGVRAAVFGYSAVALAAIGAIGWQGQRRHALGHAPPPHDRDTPEDRHRFLGFATWLLSLLSAVAVAFTTLVVVFMSTCD